LPALTDRALLFFLRQMLQPSKQTLSAGRVDARGRRGGGEGPHRRPPGNI